MKNTYRARGELRICVEHSDGSAEIIRVNNKVVEIGEQFIAARMIDNATAVVSHMAIGQGTTAASASDTALESELGRATVTAARDGNKVTYTAIFAAGVGTGAITEAGLFNAESGGLMPCRSVFGVKTKAATDVITISWDVFIEAQ